MVAGQVGFALSAGERSGLHGGLRLPAGRSCSVRPAREQGVTLPASRSALAVASSARWLSSVFRASGSSLFSSSSAFSASSRSSLP